MMNRRPSAPQGIEQFVVEWLVEDRERYELVAGRRLMAVTDASKDEGAVVTAVFDVPLPAMDGVTTALRGGRRNRHPTYLLNCANSVAERVDLGRQVDVLSMALLDLRGRIGDAAVSEAMWVATNRVALIRNALDGRRADVAAKLLAALPDDPGDLR